MPWRRRPRLLLPWLAVTVGAIAIGVVTILIVGDDESSAPADAVLPTTTDAIAALGTAAPPPPLDLCSTDPGSLAIWTAGVRIDLGTGAADAVLRFENLTTDTCELDLTDPTVRVDGAESSVRLAPGGWAELVFGSRDAQCAPLAPLRAVVLELNGDETTVPTAAVIACEQAVLAFLPADHPVDSCAASVLTTAVVTAGLVVRNDGAGPCVLGDLLSITIPTGLAPSLAEMAQTRPGHPIDGPGGPDVAGLGQGDVAYFQTIRDPNADCQSSVQPARLNFAGVAVEATFPVCTFVRLGPGHPYYGSPRGPLTDPAFADEFTPSREVWIAALDPFRE
ncbi:MAG TPA: hypothetical protein VFV63_17675 [Ilumatobacteraceae bacterium]|nr:hypothetical protein [Ilumatobacteraceae bacterium]